jgi:DNA polymerase III epsilon subunit-like protein
MFTRSCILATVILFYDTETTGLCNRKQAYTHESQPRLVQLAAVLVDESFVERSSISLIVRPGIPIPAEAAGVHGISDDTVKNFGVTSAAAVNVFVSMLSRAKLQVAHNIAFDFLVMSAAFHRAWESPLPDVPKFCTMNSMIDHCKLPGMYGDYKWPKLQEAHVHCFGAEFDGAHDALTDVRACMRVFKWIKEQEAKELNL